MLCGQERQLMKLQDKEIEEEREREREADKDKPITEIIEHFLHPHPLIYTSPSFANFSCDGCTMSGYGQRYHCAQCNFDLHEICASSPLTWLLPHGPSDEIEALGVQLGAIDTFVHPIHPVVTEYRRRSFKCDHCKNYGDGIRFCCGVCNNVRFHQVCAERPTRLTTYLHPKHELVLEVRPYFKKCDLCQTTGPKNNRMYRCKGCQFYVHPGCSQWPLFLLHPLHPPHPLVLKPCSYCYTCAACRGPMVGYKYSCKVCGLDFDPGCIWRVSKLGQGEEVRNNYGGNANIHVMPVTNLALPDIAYQSHQYQGSPFSALTGLPVLLPSSD